jgi:hypothetical protein
MTRLPQVLVNVRVSTTPLVLMDAVAKEIAAAEERLGHEDASSCARAAPNPWCG